MPLEAKLSTDIDAAKRDQVRCCGWAPSRSLLSVVQESLDMCVTLHSLLRESARVGACIWARYTKQASSSTVVEHNRYKNE
jgi:hypothetical protein